MPTVAFGKLQRPAKSVNSRVNACSSQANDLNGIVKIQKKNNQIKASQST